MGIGSSIAQVPAALPVLVVGAVVTKAVDFLATEDCRYCGTNNARIRDYCLKCGKRL